VRASSRRPRTQTGTDSAIGRIAAAHAQREERQKKKKQEEEKAERSRKKRQQQDEEEEEEEEEEAEESGERLQDCCARSSDDQRMISGLLGFLAVAAVGACRTVWLACWQSAGSSVVVFILSL
jgi:uncharacterized membrane protein YdbT with pleckstrin-like domain